MNKKLYKVKFKYFTLNYEINYKKPSCIPQEYGEFFFNWGLETAKQFARHLLTIQPTKYFISSTSEIEAITTKKEIFQQIIDKSENKKIDKFELISLIPFIVENNFEVALNISLTFFCLENENGEIITKNELGLFLDSYFRSIHNIVLVEEIDEIMIKTQKGILRLSDYEIEEILNFVYSEESMQEMKVYEVIK